MRQLKHHEKKLLKKVDFFSWKSDQNVREAQIIRKYFLQDREDYTKYNKIVGSITKLVSKLKDLPANDEKKVQMSEQLVHKLYNMGLTSDTNSLAPLEKLTVSCFCRYVDIYIYIYIYCIIGHVY